VSRPKSVDGPDGFVIVDKGPGMTSHDVVARLRRILRQRRIGHAGTLDPSATGVLVVGVGRATRLLRYLQNTTKGYQGTLMLGATTTSLDADGDITATFEMGGITEAQIEQAATVLTGDLLQTPPMVSAIKVDGRRLHELAREGREVERAARPVRVDQFSVAPTADPMCFSFEVVCSSGTYVRSLVDDLGRSLGGGAYMATLRRTAVGAFNLHDASTLEQIEDQVASAHGGPIDALMKPADGLRGIEQLVADDEATSLIRTGRALAAGPLGATGSGPFAVIDRNGGLLAVYERGDHERLVAAVVLVAT
jgi:tRNA pseudouridine55 synthase